MRNQSILIIILFVSSLVSLAQQRSVFLVEENDVFNKTDRYYTNGSGLGVNFKSDHAPIFSSLLPTPKSKEWYASYRSLLIVQKMFTPGSISHVEWQQNDVPYAGTLTLVMSSVWINEHKKLRFIPTVNVGILGPPSYAAQTQTWFHKKIHDDLPLGWNNQLRTEPILNYSLRLEKILVETKIFDLAMNSQVSTGTILNQVGLGATARIGLLNPWYASWFDQPNGYSFQFIVSGQIDRVFTNRLAVFNRTDTTFEPTVFNYAYGVEVTTPVTRISFITTTQSKNTPFTTNHRYSSLTFHVCLS